MKLLLKASIKSTLKRNIIPLIVSRSILHLFQDCLYKAYHSYTTKSYLTLNWYDKRTNVQKSQSAPLKLNFSNFHHFYESTHSRFEISTPKLSKNTSQIDCGPLCRPPWILPPLASQLSVHCAIFVIVMWDPMWDG